MGMFVVLRNEDDNDTYWYVPSHVATSAVGAKREAWRAYRDLDYKDNEHPPKWAKARTLRNLVHCVEPALKPPKNEKV